MTGETWRKRKEERERKMPKVGSLWTDKAGNVWLVKEAGRLNVWAKCLGVKRMFGLGIWLEQFEPLKIDEICG